MKRMAIFSALALIFFYSTGFGPGMHARAHAAVPLAAVTTYKDIPGVTAEEISAIEALKSRRGTLSYGGILTTEAFVLPDGSRAGFTLKLCALLSELFGIRFVQEIYEWDDLMARLDSRSLDFTGELTPTPERMRTYSMTFPIAERLLRLFTRADANKIRTEADVEGRALGFLAGVITADSVRKAYPMAFQSLDVENYSAAARMLKNGEIDGFVCESVADPGFERYDFIRSAVFFSMVHESVSMATANPELAPVISVMNKYIAAGGSDRLYALYKEGDLEYARYKLRQAFTGEERAYLDDLRQRGAAVGIAIEPDNYPISFYNEKEKEFQGISLDVLAEISKLTDIVFKAATAPDAVWAEMFEKVRNGEIPMAVQLLRSEARRGQFLWSAEPYSRSYYALMSRSDYPSLAGYQVVRSRVGVMKKSGHEDIYREIFSNADNLKEYNTRTECLDALERGDVDLVMASEHMLLTQNNYREKSGIKVNIKLSGMDSSFGFHKDERLLAAIISKAQHYVQTDAIETGWTGRMFDYSKKLAAERAFFLAILAGLLAVLLALVIALFIRDERLNRQLQEMANHDPLTGILNRRHFMELGRMQIERALRTRHECFIIIFDLDRFKSVNDHHGHLAGDKVLREIAKRVQKSIRPYDLFARYGGEEFILLMSDTDKESMLRIMERLRLLVCATPVDYDGRDISVTASFGGAFAAPVNDMRTATRHADKALYRAKEEGRNRAVFFEEEGADPTLSANPRTTTQPCP